MNHSAVLEKQSQPRPLADSGMDGVAVHVGLLALSIFLSAFLLFQVQPLISRWILPWFGGSTAVWTTCMLFFQVTLFGGYAYAHLTSRWLGARKQGLLHLLLLLAACSLLPIIPPESWKPVGNSRPTGLIMGLLTVTVGLPYFVLSSTGPLLQAWFARSHPGRSPYRLYALSNFGSLLALLSYPFVFEPLLPLPAQAWGWSIGFGVLTLTIGYCAWQQTQNGRFTATSPDEDDAASPIGLAERTAPRFGVRLLWLVLPALASVMLLATTNHVCQNVAVIPLLWIAPLSLYLLTFIICFDHPRWYRRIPAAVVTGLAAFGCAGARDLDFLYNLPLIPELGLYLVAMFGMCLVCHGELARLRPDTRHLTEFYLLMSAGGALGGVLVSLVAPIVFTRFVEWDLSLLATMCLAVSVIIHDLTTRAAHHRDAVRTSVRRLRLAACIVTVATGLAALWIAVDWRFYDDVSLARVRNFYGVIRLVDSDADDLQTHHRTFRSGGIVHGMQYCDPSRRRVPLGYYDYNAGVGRALTAAGTRGPLRVAIVGLGTGTLATYARLDDHYRFYEINPAVTDAARKWFTYLADCRGTVEVVEGDARLVLERENETPYDVIVLDAFSGDSVPVHLLTREAFAIYQRRLRPDGLILVNVLNHHLQLASEVERQADAIGLRHARIVRASNSSKLQFNTDWMILTSDADFLKALPSDVPQDLVEQEALHRHIPLWTDHYTNLVDLLTDR